MSSATDAGRAVARAALKAFGGQPEVRRFYDKAEAHSVDVLSCRDRPAPGFVTYSTVKLHEAPNVMDGSDVRVEMAGVASGEASEFPNMLATAAFFVLKDRWLCAPGVVFPSLVSDYRLSRTLEHVMWAPPFPWEELGSVEIPGSPSVHWLLAVPISESERKLLVEQGFDVLEGMLSEREVEYFDLNRPSIV